MERLMQSIDTISLQKLIQAFILGQLEISQEEQLITILVEQPDWLKYLLVEYCLWEIFRKR